MRRILIEIVGDEVIVHKPDETGAPAELFRRAADIGALSAGAAPTAGAKLDTGGAVAASAGEATARRPSRSSAPKRGTPKTSSSKRRRRSS
jgi:hypothetical protein